MQTFYAHPDFKVNAAMLDNKRLLKQLLEGRQILDALSKPERGENGKITAWSRHPASMMWKGHEGVLFDYLLHIADEMQIRNMKCDNNLRAIEDIFVTHFEHRDGVFDKPEWMLNPERHRAVIITHRGNLYHKLPSFYDMFSDEYNIYRDYICCTRCNYFWPTHTK